MTDILARWTTADATPCENGGFVAYGDYLKLASEKRELEEKRTECERQYQVKVDEYIELLDKFECSQAKLREVELKMIPVHKLLTELQTAISETSHNPSKPTLNGVKAEALEEAKSNIETMNAQAKINIQDVVDALEQMIQELKEK